MPNKSLEKTDLVNLFFFVKKKAHDNEILLCKKMQFKSIASLCAIGIELGTGVG